FGPRGVAAEELLRRAPQLAIDTNERPALERDQPLLERVQASLETYDVGLAERSHVDCVRSLVGDVRPRERRLRSLSDRAQRVAQPRVDYERAVLEAALERGVVDDELLVEVGETAFFEERADPVVIRAWRLTRCDLLVLILPLTLLEA